MDSKKVESINFVSIFEIDFIKIYVYIEVVQEKV